VAELAGTEDIEDNFPDRTGRVKRTVRRAFRARYPAPSRSAPREASTRKPWLAHVRRSLACAWVARPRWTGRRLTVASDLGYSLWMQPGYTMVPAGHGQPLAAGPFAHSMYTVKRPFWSLLGRKFHILAPDGSLVCFVKRPLLKLRQSLPIRR
jgi:hypothetical protein